MVNLKKKEIKLFFRSKKNPVAKELRMSPKYRQKIVKNKMKYDRKTGDQLLEEFKEMFGWGD